MQEISWEVNYQVFQELNAPGITISPNARTLVNLPTIVWTDYPAGIGPPATVVANDPPTITVPIHIDRPNGGLDGEIRASGELRWTFEDGGTASGGAHRSSRGGCRRTIPAITSPTPSAAPARRP